MEMWIKIKHEGATIVKLLFVPHTVLDAFLPLCTVQAPVNVSLARSPYKSVKANRLSSILRPNINPATSPSCPFYISSLLRVRSIEALPSASLRLSGSRQG